MKKYYLVILIGTLCVLTASIEVYAMRCKGGLVTTGATKYEVMTKCGKPAHRGSRTVERLMKQGDSQFVKQAITIDEWTYDMGPKSFIRILTFQDGVLADIARGTYGKEQKKEKKNRSAKKHVQKGDSKYEVLVKIGQPAFKDSTREERKIRHKDGRIEVIEVLVETWTYNMGKGRLVRSIVFRNDRVSAIDVGGSS